MIQAAGLCIHCGKPTEIHRIRGMPHTASPNGELITVLWHKGSGIYCDSNDIEKGVAEVDGS